MTIAQGLSLILLATVLVIAIWRRINIGVLALAAAFIVAVVAHADVAKMYTAFPGNLFVLIAGISLLFAHLERSGALAWVVNGVFRAIGSRTVLLPWAGFLIAAALSTMGAFSTAPIALLVPIIAHVALKYPRHFFLMELAAIIGANSAGLSPLNPTGVVISTVAAHASVHYNKWLLWAISMVVATVVLIVLQVVGRVRGQNVGRMYARPAVEEVHDPNAPVNNLYRAGAGLALVVFVVCVVGFQTDVGMTAMLMAALLQVVFPSDEVTLLRRIPWSSILLLCGLLTYLGLMQQIGTMTVIQKNLTDINNHVLLLLVVAYLTALLCNIESSTLGVLGLMMPIVISIFGGSSALTWILAAVAVPAALMVMNPIHVAGTLIIANSHEDDQPRLFRNLLGLAASLAVVVPGLMAIIPITRL